MGNSFRRPQGRLFSFLVFRPLGPEFVGNLRERGRRSPQEGLRGSRPPLGASPEQTAEVRRGEVKNRVGWWTFARRSEKPGGLVDFRTAKWKTGWFGGLFHGEAENFSTAKWESRAGWWTFARRSEKPGGQVDFSTAKRRSSGGPGRLSHGEVAKFRRPGTFARRSGELGGRAPTRV